MDAGTTNFKVVVFDVHGKELAKTSLATPVIILEEGRAVYDPEKVWETFVILIRKVISQLPDGSVIRSLAVTGMGEAGVPLNHAGSPLYPMIAWFDKRTVDIADWWKNSFSQDRLVAITGQKANFILAAHKIIWLKEYKKELFSQMWKWVCIEGFLSFRLTGKLVMEHSIACRTMFMDLEKRRWSQELLNHAGVKEDMLPVLVASGEKIGTVTKEVAQLTGLPLGMPVCTGAHDHICGAFAAGVYTDGGVLDSSGTAEVVLRASKDIDTVRRKGSIGFNAGTHVIPNTFYISGGLTASGAVMDWFHDGFSISSDTEVKAKWECPLFLPHLRGSSSPLRDTASQGAFVGINDRHGPKDFSQAVCEGLCMEYRLVQEALLDGKVPDKIVAIGGGTRNSRWMQVKANILKQSIEIVQTNEVVSLGAAMLAGIGADVYSDINDAIKQINLPIKKIHPDISLASFYDSKFELYKKLYDTLVDINRLISDRKRKESFAFV
jgi:xylulokinase